MRKTRLINYFEPNLESAQYLHQAANASESLSTCCGLILYLVQILFFFVLGHVNL